MAIAEGIVCAALAYAGLGLAFAVPFAWRWVGRLDPGAASGTTGFRVLIVPGCAALWPLLAWRLLRRTAREDPR